MRRAFALVVSALLLLTSAFAAPPTTCSSAQAQFDRTFEGNTNGTSWSTVQEWFGPPQAVEEGKPFSEATRLSYAYPGCQLSFDIGPSGRVINKAIKLGTAALLSASPSLGSAPPANTDLTLSINALQATAQQLRAQLDRLEGAIGNLKRTSAVDILPSSLPTASFSVVPGTGTTVRLPSSGQVARVPTAFTPSAPASIPNAGCAENGSCYGDISAATGRPKTVQVNGYFRKDGTYVRGHVRSK